MSHMKILGVIPIGGKGDNERALTDNEMQLIRQVYRTARLPSLLEISIADGVNGAGGAWTDSDYQINVGPSLYSADLATLTPGTLVHEMMHVWQYYNGTLTKGHAFAAHVGGSVRGWLGGFDYQEKLYSYNLGDTWDDFGFEGQAQLVEDWYQMEIEGKHMSEGGPRWIYLKKVVFERDVSARRMTLGELAQRDSVWLQRTTDDLIEVKAVSNVEFPSLTDDYLISLLQPQYRADDVAGYGARARKLEVQFRATSLVQAIVLFVRLQMRASGDRVAAYFHNHLSTETRDKLFKILRKRMAGT